MAYVSGGETVFPTISRGTFLPFAAPFVVFRFFSSIFPALGRRPFVDRSERRNLKRFFRLLRKNFLDSRNIDAFGNVIFIATALKIRSTFRLTSFAFFYNRGRLLFILSSFRYERQFS